MIKIFCVPVKDFWILLHHVCQRLHPFTILLYDMQYFNLILQAKDKLFLLDVLSDMQ